MRKPAAKKPRSEKVVAKPAMQRHVDVAGDARNLSHLIDALVSSLHEVDFVRPDGSRNEELDRVSALAWIARDLAEELMINTSK